MSPSLSPTPLSATCWVVTEGVIGMENQALGLAERLGLPVIVKRVSQRAPWRWVAPFSIGNPFQHATPGSGSLAPPWPRVLIGCGRQSIPFSIAIRKASGGYTFTVQTQKPRVDPASFDLVIPPQHDGLAGANVFPILGSPNRINATGLSEARGSFTPLFAPLKSPRLAVLIGGASNAYRFGQEEASALAETLRALSETHGLIVMTSRRTGEANISILASALAGTGAVFWDGQGENPYLGALAWADAFLVTADSINMACDAAATGKPVHVFALPGGSAKFRSFHAALAEKGIARAFRGGIEDWSYPPLDETGRAARHILDRLDVSKNAPDIRG